MAKELIMSGRAIKAQEALRIGLINAVYEQPELIPAAIALAEQIAANAPLAVKYAKESINLNYDLNREEALALENRLFARCFATEDQKNGMAAFLRKEKAEFKGK